MEGSTRSHHARGWLHAPGNHARSLLTSALMAQHPLSPHTQHRQHPWRDKDESKERNEPHANAAQCKQRIGCRQRWVGRWVHARQARRVTYGVDVNGEVSLACNLNDLDPRRLGKERVHPKRRGTDHDGCGAHHPQHDIEDVIRPSTSHDAVGRDAVELSQCSTKRSLRWIRVPARVRVGACVRVCGGALPAFGR
jgi:hypothetical protein